MKQIALFSAAQKTPEMTDFARELAKRGFTIWASGGTYKHLIAQGVETVDIATIVGAPILNHRVVSLSREIFAGILANMDSPEDRAEIEQLIGGSVEVVYVDLYHLREAMAAEESKGVDADWESLREKIDIGGPSLLRAAAKGNRFVLASTHATKRVLEVIDAPHATLDALALKLMLAKQAEETALSHAGAAARVYELSSAGLAGSRYGH